MKYRPPYTDGGALVCTCSAKKTTHHVNVNPVIVAVSAPMIRRQSLAAWQKEQAN
jgi:hypothetical protein